VVVAYLCLGYAQEFFDEPELQRRRWASRVPLDQLVYRERWGQAPTGSDRSPASEPRGRRSSPR
jgi:5,6-dimethylbenzimidazole synthase